MSTEFTMISRQTLCVMRGKDGERERKSKLNRRRVGGGVKFRVGGCILDILLVTGSSLGHRWLGRGGKNQYKKSPRMWDRMMNQAKPS